MQDLRIVALEPDRDEPRAAPRNAEQSVRRNRYVRLLPVIPIDAVGDRAIAPDREKAITAIGNGTQPPSVGSRLARGSRSSRRSLPCRRLSRRPAARRGEQ